MSARRLMTLLQAPCVTEKSTRAADDARQFVFKVAVDATKLEIKRAVELMFEVEVEMVRVCNMKGKTKSSRRMLGRRSDWKKAYVKLRPGHEIDFAEN